MDQLAEVLASSAGSIDTSPNQLRHIADLIRALKSRLTDTQINLRPTAARVIGSMLSAVDQQSQARLGKIAFSPLVSAAISDIKKPMRTASIEAIRAGITLSKLDGGERLNEETFEALINAFVQEVGDSSSKVSHFHRVVSLLSPHHKKGRRCA